MHLTRLFARIAAVASAALVATASSAQTALEDLPVIGQPEANGTGFQQAVTQQMRDIIWLDNMLLVIITLISLFVMGLLAWVIIRYNAKKNPEPATFTHNSPLEVAWTVIPIVILVFIGAFSLPVLFNQQEIPEGDITIKVTGHKWYWSYEYVDEGVDFASYMIGQPATLQSDEDAEDYIEGIQGYLIEAAGRRATEDSPLAWVSMENDGGVKGAALTLRLWPGDHHIPLGRAGFHGDWVDWTAPDPALGS